MKRGMITGRGATPLRQHCGTGILPVMHGRDAHATGRLARAIAMTVLALLPVIVRAAPFSLVQDWPDADTSGWQAADGHTLLDTADGALRITFPAQTVPAYAAELVWMPVPAGIRITNITFRLHALDRPPSAVRAVLAGAHSGITWFAPLDPPAGGSAMTVSIATAAEAGWTPGVGHDGSAWDRDRNGAAFVGLYLRRPGDPTVQRFALETFRLDGVRTIVDSDGDGIDDDWKARHGLAVGVDLGHHLSPDGSGMTYREHFIAGTDPHDPESRFAIRIAPAPDAPGAYDLEWPSAPYRWYRVLRAATPAGPYLPVSGPLYAVPPRNTYRDRAVPTGTPVFYRLEILP